MLIVIAGVICFLVWEGYFKDKENFGEDKTKQATIYVEEEKTEEKSESKKEVESVKKEEIIQYEGENPNDEEMITGAVTYAGVTGDNLVIRVNIDQYLASGSCELVLVRSGENIYNETVKVIDAVSTATCQGFNVPVSRLGEGELDVVVYVNDGERTGEIRGKAEI